MMRRISFCILVLCLCRGLPLAAQRQVAAVAFYNLENFFDPADDPEKSDEDFTPDGSHRYTEAVFRRKAHNMAVALQGLAAERCKAGPALIGVCEIEDDYVLETLIGQPELRDRHYRFIRFDGPDERGINVALIYRPDLFKVAEARALPVNLKFAGGGKTRDILLVKGSLQGETIYVLVNHWPSRGGGEARSAPKRAAAAAVVRLAADQLLAGDPHARIIVMGDLNDDPVSPSVSEVLQATGNIRQLTTGQLYNPWLSFYRQGLGTLCHRDHWNLFDQIIISASWLQPEAGHWYYDQAEVYNRDLLKTPFGRYKGYPRRSYSGNRWMDGYSDHFPAIIYLVRDKEK